MFLSPRWTGGGDEKQEFDRLFMHDLTFLPPVMQSDLPVRERIFLLLDATQTSVGGANGKFPQYYNAYYELVVGTDMHALPACIL